ncbi:LysR substrate-binding domain-containing protein [Castellaniella denitrificans]|uniref:LysR substrate-binding domain-containing protein n=1 Tax=Castellaniella denitrificans TaxID=56119 RepID=UPI001AC09384|nr:LysR family transcriptional regulator [Burkholderiales bacterium]
MNLKQINTFRAIMITGTISSAAKLLFVSQPAVSRLLAHTEQQLGYPLFERIKGRLYPTTEARLLFNEVQSVYSGITRISALAHQLGEKKQGLLGIVSSPSLGHGLMPRCIERFTHQHPGVRIRLRTLTYDALVRSILDGESEIGLLFMPAAHPNLKSTQVGAIPLVCVLPGGHPLADQPAIDLSDLRDQAMIAYRSGSPLAKVLSDLFGEGREPERILVEVDAQQNVCDLVSQGLGVGIVDQAVAAAQTSDRLVVRPLRDRHTLELYLACSRYEPLPLLARAFGQIVEQEAGLL